MHNRFVSRYCLIAATLATPLAAASAASAGNPAEYTAYSFSVLGDDSTNSDGASPSGNVIVAPDGSYYGVTFQGGANGGGVVYRLKGGSLTVLHAFSSSEFGVVSDDGAEPTGSLLLASDGNLYGTTLYGGANNNGTIFKLTPDGTFTVLHTFAASAIGSNVNADGMTAFGRLQQGSDGNLYGTAEFGGTSGSGTIYRITPAGDYTVLYTFTGGSDGFAPFAGLTAGADGNFYGTTQSTFFRITPAGGFTSLFAFPILGEEPDTGVVLGNDGNFYGLTNGELNKPGTGGTFYRLTPSGAYTALSTLDAPTYAIFNDLGQHVGPNVDGLNAYNPLVKGADGNFYGLASQGGAAHMGTLFKVSPQGVFTNLHSFDLKPDGTGKAHAALPASSLAFDADGNLIGAGEAGGANQSGVVFKLQMNSPLTANLTITPGNVSAGQDATFSWTSTGATSCSFVGTDIESGRLPPNGSVSHAGPASGKKMVTSIQCKDRAGGFANSTAELTAN
jgi:uncharacterized repeat protein (TIGR03803 family)